MSTKTQLEISDAVISIMDSCLWAKDQEFWSGQRQWDLIDNCLTHILNVNGYHIGEVINVLEAQMAEEIRKLSDSELVYGRFTDQLGIYRIMLDSCWKRCK